MSMSVVKKGYKVAKSDSKLDSIFYMVFLAFTSGLFITLFKIFLPGMEFDVFGRSVVISQEFVDSNFMWISMLGSLLGITVSSLFITLHKWSLKRRFTKFSSMYGGN